MDISVKICQHFFFCQELEVSIFLQGIVPTLIMSILHQFLGKGATKATVFCVKPVSIYVLILNTTENIPRKIFFECCTGSEIFDKT